jgi:multidrug efflux pump subunit AcrA (membrane-fusion protein)
MAEETPTAGPKDEPKAALAPAPAPTTPAPPPGERPSWVVRVAVPALTAIGGFIVAIGTIWTPLIQRDVRNQVYEATFQEKNRVLQAQTELLQLQENYLKKLAELKQAQDQLDSANKRVAEKESELDRLRVQSAQEKAALSSRYAKLVSVESERNAMIAKAKQTEADQQKRIAPFKDYGCHVDHNFTRTVTSVCDRGWKATFAMNTPDEKVVFHDQPICGEHSFTEYEPARTACEQYARAFLLGKGLTEEDVQLITFNYAWRDMNADAKKAPTAQNK